MSLHPEAVEVRDRLERLLTQGKVCPVCGAALQIMQPTRDGMFEDSPLVLLECSRSTNCWSWDPTAENEAWNDPETEHVWMEYLETGHA